MGRLTGHHTFWVGRTCIGACQKKETGNFWPDKKVNEARAKKCPTLWFLAWLTKKNKAKDSKKKKRFSAAAISSAGFI
jgi:hypothetical protein